MTVDSFTIGKGRKKTTNYWSPTLPARSFLEEKPVFFVVAKPGINGGYTLLFPHPKPFPTGYAASELDLFDPRKRARYCSFFPLIGKPFLCRWDQENNTVSSTISLRIMYGEVTPKTLEEVQSKPVSFKKSYRPLYDETADGGILVPASRIICGEVRDEIRETTPDNLIFFHARTTKVLASNVAARDKGESFVVMGASGDCYYVSEPAQRVFDAPPVLSAPQLVAV